MKIKFITGLTCLFVMGALISGCAKTTEQSQNDLDFKIDNQISFYCGTGWRASIPFLIMYENGYDNMSVYDGGWYEWQMNKDLPVQIGDHKGKVTYSTVGELSNDKQAKK